MLWRSYIIIKLTAIQSNQMNIREGNIIWYTYATAPQTLPICDRPQAGLSHIWCKTTPRQKRPQVGSPGQTKSFCHVKPTLLEGWTAAIKPVTRPLISVIDTPSRLEKPSGRPRDDILTEEKSYKSSGYFTKLEGNSQNRRTRPLFMPGKSEYADGHWPMTSDTPKENLSICEKLDGEFAPGWYSWSHLQTGQMVGNPITPPANDG